MFDHVSLKVRDFHASFAFYRAALAPLGFEPDSLDEAGRSAGFRRDGNVWLWIAEGTPATTAFHLAFQGASRAAVGQFYQRALATGGRDNGGPDVRPDYAADYYAAFVLDPDGNNIEVVVHEAKPPATGSDQARARGARPRARVAKNSSLTR